MIHCFDCNVDICFICYKEFHKLHKMEYLKQLNYDKILKSSFESELEEDRKYIESFIVELMHFKSQLNLFIDILNSSLKKLLKFRYDLINNISPENSPYINIENAKNFNDDFSKMKNFIRKFLYCDYFVKRYDNLRNIFELMFKKGKYIESQNIKDILKENIIPIDEKYFMKIDKKKLIILEKALELNLNKYKFNKIFERSINFGINKIKLKANENIKQRLSLYTLSDDDIYQNSLLHEITIQNLSDFNIKEIATFNRRIKLFVLSENKNIIDDGQKIILYDDSFKSSKLFYNKKHDLKEFLKIDSNTFIFSLNENSRSNVIFLAQIIDKNINVVEIFIYGYKFVYFSEKKKIIFSHNTNFIYLTSFNDSRFELIQKIELKDNYYEPFNDFINNTKLIGCLTSFNDESIYIRIKINNKQFLVQYKIIESELMEISRIEINNY